MGKPNLKVVVGKAASVQINIDKSKNINVEQTQAVSKPAEKEGIGSLCIFSLLML